MIFLFIIARAKTVIFVLVCAAIFVGVIIAVASTPVTPSGVAKKYIAQLGWKVMPTPLEEVSVKVPLKFDAVYLRYNELQKEAGFDLSPYVGKALQRVTFNLLNFPYDNNVRINVLVMGTNVVGGDISTVAINGFMIPLEGRSETLFLEDGK